MKYVTDKFKNKGAYEDIKVFDKAHDKDPDPEKRTGCSFDDFIALKGKKNIGEGMDKIIARLADENTDLKGVIDIAHFNDEKKLGSGKEMVDKLTDLISIFQRPELDFSRNKAEGDDIIGDAYEYLMKMYATFAGKSGGEFFTPQEASKLLALITTWGKHKVNKVYDPACGSGSLLMQVAKVLGKDKVLGGFFGQEKEPTIHQLCRMNMFLHDIDPRKFDIALGDTLIHPNERHLDAEPFEVVVSNPPYSIEWAGDSDPTLASDERFAPAGVLAPKKAADFAFILHALSWLAESGCAAIVCFPGIFYRKGAEQKIRQYLVDNNFVDAIIDLPANLFFGTSIATTILVLRKNKKNDNNVLFVSGCDEFVKEGNKNKLTDANIDAIFKLYTDRKTVKYKTRLVPYEEIAKNGFNLSVATYVDTTPPAPPKDLKAIGARVKAATKETDKCRAAVDEILKELI